MHFSTFLGALYWVKVASYDDDDEVGYATIRMFQRRKVV